MQKQQAYDRLKDIYVRAGCFHFKMEGMYFYAGCF